MARSRKNTKRTQNLRFSSSRGQKEYERFRLLVRYSAWLLILLAVIALFAGGVIGLWQVLIVRNDHFTLKNIKVNVYGDLKADKVRRQLQESGIEPYETNLFEFDLEKVRHIISQSYVSLNRVQAERELPSALVVDIYQRDPVAQLVQRRGKLIDSNGLILPVRQSSHTWSLPIITGIPHPDKIKVGREVDDKLVTTALELLKTVRTDSFHREYLTINLIQLDKSAEALKVYVGQKRPLREGACLVLPGNREKLKPALYRIRKIIEHRARRSIPITFIDATYEINVPVKP